MVRSAHEQRSIAPDGRPPEEQPKWRGDFPIDSPQDEFIARRDFTKFMVLTSAAFVVGQFWILLQNMIRKRRGRPPVRMVARLDQLPVGGSLVFFYPGPDEPCVLMRLSAERLVAYSQKCTHLSCAVKPQPERGTLYCPCHEGLFEASTGRPLAGPPRRPLPRIEIEIRDGLVYATGVDLRTI